MQNRYVGDIGDFTKYSLLNAISKGQKLGIAWYLFPDENHNEDGKHINYLKNPKKWRHLDKKVFDCLQDIIQTGHRNVGAIEDMGCVNAMFFSDRLLDCDYSKYIDRENWRMGWFTKTLHDLAACDIVFADPDNGLYQNKKYKMGKKKMWKSIPCEEARSLAVGRTAVIYHHNTRKKGGHRKEIQEWMAEINADFAVYSKIQTCRTYFVINANKTHMHHVKNWCKRYGEKVELITSSP